MKYKKLTQSQLHIMKILWNEKKPMIASDFVQLDSSLNLNSVQSALRSLLKKNYIEVIERLQKKLEERKKALERKS